MTINQALKYKNKLVKKISEAFQKVYTYNSLVEGQVRPYDIQESLNEYFKLSSELVELKTKIHKANQPVYDKIFYLSELKSQASKLSVLDCTEGRVVDRFSRMNEGTPDHKTAVIKVVDKDNLIAGIEKQIESVQEELELHNSTVHI